MNTLTKFVAVFAVAAVTVLGADLKREPWHTPIREYQAYDSVLFPEVDYALIQKIKVGMTFEEVKKLTGFLPVNYHIHPDYALLGTKVGDDHYEVAFLHKNGQKIQAISFRKMKKSEPNQSPEPTPTAVTPPAGQEARPMLSQQKGP